MPGALRDQKGLDPLKLGLQMFVSFCVVLGIELGSSGREAGILVTEPSPQSPNVSCKHTWLVFTSRITAMISVMFTFLIISRFLRNVQQSVF